MFAREGQPDQLHGPNTNRCQGRSATITSTKVHIWVWMLIWSNPNLDHRNAKGIAWMSIWGAYWWGAYNFVFQGLHQGCCPLKVLSRQPHCWGKVECRGGFNPTFGGGVTIIWHIVCAYRMRTSVEWCECDHRTCECRSFIRVCLYVHGTMMMIHIAFAHKHNTHITKLFEIPV